MSNSLVLSIGSNNPDRERQMKSAIEWLRKQFESVRISDVYEADAENGIDGPYLNAVMSANTTLPLDAAVNLTKQWETLCGRTPVSKIKGEIPIDIDIVIWNGEIIRQAEFGCPYFKKGYDKLLSL